MYETDTCLRTPRRSFDFLHEMQFNGAEVGIAVCHRGTAICHRGDYGASETVHMS